MTTTIVPVILSGGSGTRLWPLSTDRRPKQFLPLVEDRTMFAATLARVADRRRYDAPVIVCGFGHVAHVAEDLASAGIEDARIIVEPAARNTAPAIALAAHAVGADATMMLVMPSDHVISDPATFHAAVEHATPAVERGALATFGIAPAGPETGYGYIACHGDEAVRQVERFIEKPDADRAQAMIDAGGHYWNAGIFLMRADAYLAALDEHAGEIAVPVAQAMAEASSEGGTVRPESQSFHAAQSDSIDYAVMERSGRVVSVPTDPGWSDVGSWSAIYDLSPKDVDGNVADEGAIILDARRNLVRSAGGPRISLLGVDDLIVVATADEVMVLPRARAQDVKRLVAEAKRRDGKATPSA